jgi:hypothetical protein
MENEQEQVASMGKTYSGIDLESIRENSVLLMVCVRDVTKRPRYFQWNEQMGLASGASERHPYPSAERRNQELRITRSREKLMKNLVISANIWRNHGQ